jgi:hypothetical protein
VQLSAPRDQWFVTLWGRNLTDQHYFANVAVTANEDRGQTADPITFGFSVGFNL